MTSDRRKFLKNIGLSAAGLVVLPHTYRGLPPTNLAPVTLEREAKDTVTAVEMNCGDTLKFRLRNGQVRSIVLEDTEAQIIEDVPHGGIVYRVACRVCFDGQRFTFQRYVGSQETFYEPYVVNGTRIWFDIASDIFDLIPMRTDHWEEAGAVPGKHARFALQDATLAVAPQEMKHWYPNSENYIEVGDCYNGDDVWLGAYLGRALHGGLDINHTKGDPLWAPIDLDDHFMNESLEEGHRNNHWRGIRRWANGDTWVLETHHVIELTEPPHAPLKAGQQFGTGAGIATGLHDHSHFVFKVVDQTQQDIWLDPWILFWQIFEMARWNANEIQADMRPLSPAHTGEEVMFVPEGSRTGPETGGPSRANMSYYWRFGDGGWANTAVAKHTYARPGVYPVTLVVDDGVDRATYTQHITVSGPPAASPSLVLEADDISFHRRRPEVTDVYGWPVSIIPHTLAFTARPSRPVPNPGTVTIKNAGTGTLSEVREPSIRYVQGGGWLDVVAEGSGNAQSLKVEVDATGLSPGTYAALVGVDVPWAANSPEGFRVVLTVPETAPDSQVTIDDASDGFYATPGFWVGHQFIDDDDIWNGELRTGHRRRYLTNGARAVEGEFVRFTPDLQEGTYEVSVSEETPVVEGARFTARVRSKAADQFVTVTPERSKRIGTFEFDEGTDGFVEFLAGGSTGLIVADAVTFTRVG